MNLLALDRKHLIKTESPTALQQLHIMYLQSQVIGSGVGFYKEFFTSQQEGLMKERVQNSPSECSAIIAAFMECLRFCLLRGFDGDEPDVTIQEYLIKEQVGGTD